MLRPVQPSLVPPAQPPLQLHPACDTPASSSRSLTARRRSQQVPSMRLTTRGSHKHGPLSRSVPLQQAHAISHQPSCPAPAPTSSACHCPWLQDGRGSRSAQWTSHPGRRTPQWGSHPQLPCRRGSACTTHAERTALVQRLAEAKWPQPRTLPTLLLTRTPMKHGVWRAALHTCWLADP